MIHMKRIIVWMSRVLLAYAVAGLTYGCTGRISKAILGKEEVFSPLLSLPLHVVGWPWMVYADLKHVGVQLQDVLALVALVVCVVIMGKKAADSNATERKKS